MSGCTKTDLSGGESPVYLVTGAARGIGLGVARALADEGARVHVVWRSDDTRARELCREFGPAAHRADLEHEEDARSLIEEVVHMDGALHGLVHAVGPYGSGSLEETSPDQLRGLLRGNVESAFLLFGAARSALRAARGNAIFFGTSGLEGMRARRTTAAYTAAKSALRVLVRSWALEEAPHGLRVNMVSPGHVPHPDAHPDTRDPSLLAAIPLGRPGTPEDLAEAVRWLLSDGAATITGVDLPVTGGWLL